MNIDEQADHEAKLLTVTLAQALYLASQRATSMQSAETSAQAFVDGLRNVTALDALARAGAKRDKAQASGNSKRIAARV